MSTNYPSGTDSLTNPAGTNTLPGTESGGIPHAELHTNISDAVEAIQSSAGTHSGTNVLKHFAAGHFPVRATGVAATGTLVQTIVGGTLNKNTLGSVGATGGTFKNTVVGTPAITGGTSTAMKVVGTDILSTPLVDVKCLLQLTVGWDEVAASTGTVRLSINGSVLGTSSGGVSWMYNEFTAGNSAITSTTHYITPTLAANDTHTIITPFSTSSGTLRIYRSLLSVIPFPAT